jgi:hypothetical protein
MAVLRAEEVICAIRPCFAGLVFERGKVPPSAAVLHPRRGLDSSAVHVGIHHCLFPLAFRLDGTLGHITCCT